MVKFDRLKKRLLIEGGGIALILLIMAGLVFLLGAASDDYAESNTAMQGRLDSLDSETGALRARYNFILKNLALYQEVQKKQTSGQFSISRQLVLDKFNQFRSKFGLNDLRVTVAPAAEMKAAQFKRKTHMVNFSEVQISLDTLSDENIYALLTAMKSDLPGVCVISHLTIIKDKPVNDEILHAIVEKSTYPLIRADIKFIWYSINPIEPPDANAAPKK